MDAVRRRDGIKIMPSGIAAANRLGLTNAVPAANDYVTDGRARDIKVDGWTIRLRHAQDTITRWANDPIGPAVQALYWLKPNVNDLDTMDDLRRALPDATVKALADNMSGIPVSLRPVAQRLAA